MRSVFLKTNVTVVKFLGHHLLAGVGSELHVYLDTNQKDGYWENYKSIKVFSSQNIFGILEKDSKILVYGGRKLAIIEYSLETMEFKILKNCSFNDWILDAMWLDNENECIAILAANNIVHKFNLISEKSIANVKCEELCILYSGKILNNIWEELVILAGTVFQEIVIWTLSNGTDCCTLHRLKGHKGVIFSVNYDSKSNLICSTSDDRTVRLWKVQSFSNDKKLNWRECSISLKVTIFSHLARVWKSYIISENKIISIGEDSLISIWNEHGICINQWCGHQGGAIWSVDYSEELELIATGGSDGGINIWPLSESLEPNKVYQSSSLDDICVPRSVILTSSSDIILITDRGKLKYYKDQWITCMEDNKFSSYCVMQISPNRQFLALANIVGDVIISKVGNDNILKIWFGNIIKGRIFSLIWLTNSFIITCGPDGELILWEFYLNPEPILKKVKEYILPYSKERWITSALLFEGFILCGDRCGSVYLYELSTSVKEPLHSVKKLHGYKGVSSIKLISNTIISTGRDGTYRKLSISDKSIKVIDCNKLQMEWIAKIEETLLFGTIIAGFHDTHIIIWSCREGRALLKMDCGGGHRSWDYYLDESKNCLTVIFIKDKAVYRYHRPLDEICHRTAEVGYHSKSINSACLLTIKQRKDDLILTGGEDNSLRLFSWDDEIFSPLVTLNRHISSIRAIYNIEDVSSNSLYVASSGGRGQLILWQVTDYEGQIKIVEAASHMVREMDNQQSKNSKYALPLADPETRYMDVNIVKVSKNNFLILAGCSDGLFRILNFDTQFNKISVNKVCSFHEHCILKVANFFWKNIFAITMTTDGKVSFWNVSTIIQNDTQADYKPKSFSIHSLGVNSYSLLLEKDSLILATGSDDSTLAVSVFDLKENNEHLLVTCWTEKTLHTCQITGVQILENLVITVALDQRISLLKWKLDDGVLTVSLIKQVLTTIPDVHGLLAWIKPENTVNVCTYGLGIEILADVIEAET